MKTRIENCLKKAGLPEIPDSPQQNLSDWGLDSLVMVKSLVEFENEFNLRITAEEFSEEAFESLDALEKYLQSLGAQ
ncbi:MAG: hypothetical protein CME62_00700 [Halobacteriovoraceae bacterium]|nr:hypothetical protein [Halobacteriovoraceae bacterium]|tara:strand:+ start:20783 stop:21013 length:231 start_codon:yes stop_codon:yes gene_type:complete